MYLTLTSCPSAVLSVRMYCKVHSGHIFFTIRSPMDPAAREVREPLQPLFRVTPTSLAASILKLFMAARASGTMILLLEDLLLFDLLREDFIK